MRLSCRKKISITKNDTYERGSIKKLGECVQFLTEMFGGWQCSHLYKMANAQRVATMKVEELGLSKGYL